MQTTFDDIMTFIMATSVALTYFVGYLCWLALPGA
jgi:hypothetical protein